MDRVITLSEKFQKQLENSVSIDDLIVTVQMIQSELMHLKSKINLPSQHPAVGMHLPDHMAFQIIEKEPLLEKEEEKKEKALPISEEKVVLTLQLNEEEIETELEEIKKSAEAKISASIKNKPAIQFDPIEDIPTLIHQKPNQDIQPTTFVQQEKKETSINELFKQTNKELSDSFTESPIKDLKKAIGINDRYLFINELFLGDEVMYDRSIKTINSFSIYPEAEYWIRRELKLKLGWIEQSEAVQQFNQLVKRRFNVI